MLSPYPWWSVTLYALRSAIYSIVILQTIILSRTKYHGLLLLKPLHPNTLTLAKRRISPMRTSLLQPILYNRRPNVITDSPQNNSGSCTPPTEALRMQRNAVLQYAKVTQLQAQRTFASAAPRLLSNNATRSLRLWRLETPLATVHMK
jgi:hypothetical protein